MKTFALAAALATLSTASMASDLSFIGNAEYAVEAEAIETNIGVEFVVFDGLVVSPLMSLGGDTDSFDFTGAELNAIYSLTSNMNVYGKIETDADFGYAETTLGVAFRF